MPSTRRAVSLRTEGSNEEPSTTSSPRATEPPADLCPNVLSVALGDRLMTPWFPSFYREEIVSGSNVQRLYVCDRCFKYSTEPTLIRTHKVCRELHLLAWVPIQQGIVQMLTTL